MTFCVRNWCVFELLTKLLMSISLHCICKMIIFAYMYCENSLLNLLDISEFFLRQKTTAFTIKFL